MLTHPPSKVPAPSAFNDGPTFSITPPEQCHTQPNFSLDTAGVAGLLSLGGTVAMLTMAFVHVYGSGRWLGWYNNPGSFQISKRLFSFAKSIPFHIIGDSISPKSLSDSIHLDLLQLFPPDRSAIDPKPKFQAAHSGTVTNEVGYLAGLFMKECVACDSEGRAVSGAMTEPIKITVAELGQGPAPMIYAARGNSAAHLFACIPISASVVTCVLCAVHHDWYGSLLILIGIIATGVSCLVLGSARLMFTHPQPARGSPAGDGILGSDKHFILLRGEEGAVNSITHGRLSLQFSSMAHFRLVWLCAALFLAQGVTQLLLTPRASLFGQVMFVISLVVSALYNAWFSWGDEGMADLKVLFERILQNVTLSRYTLGSRASAAVFMLLVLRPQAPAKVLDELVPNNTKVWKQWKTIVLEELQRPRDQALFRGRNVGRVGGFRKPEQDLLEQLYGDARAAYDGYRSHFESDPS